MNQLTFSLVFVFLLNCGLFYFGDATSLTNKIYYDILPDGFSMCFRRFNATHQIGCSSDRSGNVGVVHLIQNNSDVDWLVNNGPHPPYMAIMNIYMFNRDVFDQLVKSKKVNGLVVVMDSETDRPEEGFSPDTKCPNDRYGLYSGDSSYGSCDNITWNPTGNGMMFEDIPFPMVTISNKSDISFIIQDCYKKFNQPVASNVPKGYSLCAMEIKDIMDGAKDTPTCHRRTNLVTNLNPQGYCDPLGNINVHSFLDYLNSSRELDNQSVILIAARLDAFSLFDHRYPGYDSATLGFITVQAVAEALGKVRKSLLNAVYNNPVMFALFQGEAFEYIGSSRMVYDMEQRKFLPVNIENIRTFIEIGQVGLYNESDPLYLHTDPISIHRSKDVQARVKSLVNLLSDTGKGVELSIEQAPEGTPLPSSSMQQFLKSPNALIAGVVLSNHKSEFANRYYNSIYDISNDTSNATDPETYNDVTPVVTHLQKISTTVARTVYHLLLGNSSIVENIASSNVTIANLLYCFTKNPDCELFNMTSEYGKSGNLKSSKSAYLSRYVGVHGSDGHLVSHQNELLFAHFLGTKMENATTAGACQKLDEKKDGYKYFFLNGQHNSSDNNTRVPICIQATADTTDGLSPAFIIENYNWSSNMYSAWTESRWETGAMQMRVFLMPNLDQEIITLCIGLGVLILSSILVFLIQRKAETLFTSTIA